MTEETFSQDFKRIFLLAFTKELIIHSAKKDIIKLQKIIQSREQKKQEELLGEPLKIFTRELGEEKIPSKPVRKPAAIQLPPPQLIKRPVAVEVKPKPFIRPRPTLKLLPVAREPILPPHLEYLKPIPTPGVEMDLMLLNPLVKDIAVRLIEANPNERVVVSGTMGTKPTSIILSEEDIDTVIDKFVQATKIPAEEGIYRVAVGNLVLSAVISDITSSRFIIKKMSVNPSQNQNPNPFQSQQPKNPLLPPAINMERFS